MMQYVGDTVGVSLNVLGYFVTVGHVFQSIHLCDGQEIGDASALVHNSTNNFVIDTIFGSRGVVVRGPDGVVGVLDDVFHCRRICLGVLVSVAGFFRRVFIMCDAHLELEKRFESAGGFESCVCVGIGSCLVNVYEDGSRIPLIE